MSLCVASLVAALESVAHSLLASEFGVDESPERTKCLAECLLFRSAGPVVLFVGDRCFSIRPGLTKGLITHEPHSRERSVLALLDRDSEWMTFMDFGSRGFHMPSAA
jgi:hypothetical protein